MRTFFVVWFGQLVSLFGTSLTSFTLGVWVYQRTGSATQFALISLFAQLPGILVSPVAGALIDRWDRRRAMILSDSGAGLSTLVVVLLLLAGRLEVWHIYLTNAVSSIFSAFQWPAYSAATTLLVPKKHLGRASGMVQFSEAAARIFSPVLGGLLVVTIQLSGVISIDITTFIFSLVTLLLVRFPRPKNISKGKEGGWVLLQEAAYGWTYITTRPGLLGLLIFFAANNFLTGVVTVLFTPLVLAFAPMIVLGIVLSVGGGGILVGSLVMSIWGGAKRRRINSVLSFTLLSGLCILLAGLRHSVPVFFVTVFLYFFGLAIINSSSQVIWQNKVPPEVQGRVFAVRRMIAWASLPLAYMVAGPLADQVFEPLLAAGGPLVGTIGRVIGVGPGHGIALLFVLMGMLSMLVTVGGYLYPPLRLVEEELPDAIADEAPAHIEIKM